MTDTVYDDNGCAVLTTDPYISGDTIYATQTIYDGMGRVTETRRLAGSNALREALQARRFVVAPGCYDAPERRIAEKHAFGAVYMSGLGVTASLLARPDLELLGMAEMVRQAGLIASAVTIPVISDADTGYGGLASVNASSGVESLAGTSRESGRRALPALPRGRTSLQRWPSARIPARSTYPAESALLRRKGDRTVFLPRRAGKVARHLLWRIAANQHAHALARQVQRSQPLVVAL